LYGDAHEANPDQPQNEKDMDLHNNGVGYKIGIMALKNGWDDAQILDAVMNAKDNGELQTSLK